MINLNLKIFIVVLLFISLTINQDFNGTDKNGVNFIDATCNKDTTIDFSFNSATKLTCISNSCSTSLKEQSYLNFLDVFGQDLTLPLISASVNNQTFKFIFNKQNHTVQVYINYENPLNSRQNSQIINLNNFAVSAFSNLKGKLNITNFSLSVFNFLNLRDYSQFYHTYDGSLTILKSYWIYTIDIQPSTIGSLTVSTPKLLSQNGDLLCYGSSSEGIFQTHLRESYPLWTVWFGILIYWSIYLLTQSSGINCYDKDFQNNKMTCWSLYSLFYVNNEQFFTKLSRLTLILVSTSIDAVVLAAIYSTIGSQFNEGIIAWTPFIAVICSFTISFILGFTFLNNIYHYQLHKYQLLRKMKGLFNKDQGSNYQTELQNTQQILYGFYYWYYVFAFVFFVISWVVSIHLMQQIPRTQYKLHSFWLSSLAIAFVFEHLLLQPILALIFGGMQCYQSRGYYFQFKLGQQYKQVEQ